ncbi:MAG: LAGLIDADG family homing endonuclease [Candidatus Staskawiczbacteria bacterium]|nr:LAGLIDADG family homing endonuclease [Candidatus Staskawiczbacteria bacterium]
MLEKNKINILQLINKEGCFDLQFRRDTRHERKNAPTYYRWKVQFVVTGSKGKRNILKKIKSIIGCGDIHIIKDQARFSVQKIDDINNTVVPFFRKNQLENKKKKDFELWKRAVAIIYKNKGKYLLKWKKNDLLSLIEIQKSVVKYKIRPKKPKWVQMALALAKNI